MSDRLRNRLRTAATIGVLAAALPLDLALSGAAAIAGRVRPRPAPTPTPVPRTVLLSGGKMTKSLALARAFHRAGHRVVLVETAKYRLGAHRFSHAVDAFHVVPPPDDPDYAAALQRIVLEESVDVYVPVCSPLASRHDAAAADQLSCEVLHVDAEVIGELDDKDRFAAAAEDLGLSVPATFRVTSPQEVLDHPALHDGRDWILKSIPYDAFHRLDLTRLPLATEEATAAHVRSKPISPDRPWILQEFVAGQEYCAHATVRDGDVQVWACCESSPFQLNYEQVDEPEILDWVSRFCKGMGLTGQVSFDFIRGEDGVLRAIECNPRTHSAITMFHDHPDLAAAYLDDGHPMIEPLPGSRPTYWLHHELWQAVTRPGEWRERVRTLLAGTDAVLDRADPLPFLLLPHLQLTQLLVRKLASGTPWVRLDVNIGKVVEPGGD